jgi:hypothetical protein
MYDHKLIQASAEVCLIILTKNSKLVSPLFLLLIDYFKEAFGENKYGITSSMTKQLFRMCDKGWRRTETAPAKYKWNFVNYERVMVMIHLVKVDSSIHKY